jgi:hypothetical protein
MGLPRPCIRCGRRIIKHGKYQKCCYWCIKKAKVQMKKRTKK